MLRIKNVRLNGEYPSIITKDAYIIAPVAHAAADRATCGTDKLSFIENDGVYRYYA